MLKEGQGRALPGVTLGLLGEFTVNQGDERVDLPLMSQRLVALVALSDWPPSRARISGLLWPDAPEAQGARCLRTAIWRASAGGCRVLSTWARWLTSLAALGGADR
ncbi:MAG TPA: hypothetical protein VGS19_20850 [Streptosporangiaceae bacterium]|nr:hypothetical protein [Streptosporangiaceae bacterium]